MLKDKRSAGNACDAVLPLKMDTIHGSKRAGAHFKLPYLPCAKEIVDVYPASKRLEHQRTSNLPPSSIIQGSSSSPTFSLQKCSRYPDRSSPSRNIQVPANQVQSILHKLSLYCGRKGKIPDHLVCPVEKCPYEQKNGQFREFRRHILTHVGRAKFRCIGVPWEHRHLFSCLSEGHQPYDIEGFDGWWVGGCLRTFSRRDALQRHLKSYCCVALATQK